MLNVPRKRWITVYAKPDLRGFDSAITVFCSRFSRQLRLHFRKNKMSVAPRYAIAFTKTGVLLSPSNDCGSSYSATNGAVSCNELSRRLADGPVDALLNRNTGDIFIPYPAASKPAPMERKPWWKFWQRLADRRYNPFQEDN